MLHHRGNGETSCLLYRRQYILDRDIFHVKVIVEEKIW